MKSVVLAVGMSLGLLVVGCASGSKHSSLDQGAPAYYAIAVMRPTNGKQTEGRVVFSEAFGKVKVSGEIRGLQKNLEHGFHIHEFGNCTAADASSAGGHYNPKGHVHSGPTADLRHAGDLGNILADKDGVAKFEFTIEDISINSGVNPILGRGLIVHENKDDLLSQPTGGAGPRIACGVIGVSSK